MKTKKNLNNNNYIYNGLLNIRSGKKEVYKLIKKNHQGVSAQMVIIAGIIISVTIISMALAVSSLSDVGVKLPMERSTSILTEYRSIRSAFIEAMDYGCSQMGYETNTIVYVFNETKRSISDLELRYGRYFDAELNTDGIEYYNSTSQPTVYIPVHLTLTSEKSSIDENIEIPLTMR